MSVVMVLSIFVGLLCAMNLVLTTGVIRRLREHSERLADLSGVSLRDTMQPPDGRVGEFQAVTTTGASLSDKDLTGYTLVGAFAQGCPLCKEALPEFARLAEMVAGGRENVVAVFLGERSALAGEYAPLEPLAQVIVEEPPGKVAEALGISGYPTFGILDGSGLVLVSGSQPAHVEGFRVGR